MELFSDCCNLGLITEIAEDCDKYTVIVILSWQWRFGFLRVDENGFCSLITSLSQNI